MDRMKDVMWAIVLATLLMMCLDFLIMHYEVWKGVQVDVLSWWYDTQRLLERR